MHKTEGHRFESQYLKLNIGRAEYNILQVFMLQTILIWSPENYIVKVVK